MAGKRQIREQVIDGRDFVLQVQPSRSRLCGFLAVLVTSYFGLDSPFGRGPRILLATILAFFIRAQSDRMAVFDPAFIPSGAARAKASVADQSPAASAWFDWLQGHALPLWSTVGVDRRVGGFFEKIDLQGQPVEERRRARVVARQIYVFATAARRGWMVDADERVEHGLRFLFDRMRLPGGTIAAAVNADGGDVCRSFDLYEHAFVLFALAAASEGRPDRAPLRVAAEALLRRMRLGWAHPSAGFEEARPRTLPLKSNPHMHLLEAALAWADISTGDEKAVWSALAAEIVDLCLSRFIDRDGALHEYFDGDWQPMPGSPGRVVEPGHQFEWAWLLFRWAAATGSLPAAHAGQRMLEIGEVQGVDPTRGVAVNALGDDFAVIDGNAKLWPQTERIKAWHAAATGGTRHQMAQAPRALDASIRALMRYFVDSPRGLWREQLGPDGQFAVQDCRASSLYHIVCAIDVVRGGALGPRPPFASAPT